MSKKRVLMVSEHHIAKSGFGLYTREILNRLHKTGKYELAELSCFNNGDYGDVPWKVYPNAVDGNSKYAQKYNADHENVFGKWRFDQTLLHFKPDIVFDIRDYWMLAFEELSILRPYFNWVVAPTIDSLPQQDSWLQTFSNADLALAHTDWGVDALKHRGNINTGMSVSDSVDTNVFRPLNYSLKLNKAMHLVPENSFVVGAVMRNQKRKLIPNLMTCIRNLRLLTKRTDIYLYLHTSYPEKQGWDIPSLLLENDAQNYVLFTYFCKKCKKAFASHWCEANRNCPFCDGQKTAAFPNVLQGLDDNHLKNIYNIFDVYVQYAICEGLGIPQLEAASCGVPVFSVDYSAMSEVTTKLNAGKISYALFKELETGAFRAIPNDSYLIKCLDQYMQKTEEEKQQDKTNIRANILKEYSWDKTAARYEEIFDNLESKNIWDKPLMSNPQAPVPKDLSNRDFVYFILDNVIQSPFLKRTHWIQGMIKNMDLGYVHHGASIQPFDRKRAQTILEGMLNHKIHLEQIRSGQAEDNSYFLHGKYE